MLSHVDGDSGSNPPHPKPRGLETSKRDPNPNDFQVIIFSYMTTPQPKQHAPNLEFKTKSPVPQPRP